MHRARISWSLAPPACRCGAEPRSSPHLRGRASRVRRFAEPPSLKGVQHEVPFPVTPLAPPHRTAHRTARRLRRRARRRHGGVRAQRSRRLRRLHARSPQGLRQPDLQRRQRARAAQGHDPLLEQHGLGRRALLQRRRGVEPRERLGRHPRPRGDRRRGRWGLRRRGTARRQRRPRQGRHRRRDRRRNLRDRGLPHPRAASGRRAGVLRRSRAHLRLVAQRHLGDVQRADHPELVLAEELPHGRHQHDPLRGQPEPRRRGLAQLVAGRRRRHDGPGTCHASGNSGFNDKAETASALLPGASATGPWSDANLTESGKWAKAYIAKGTTTTPPPPPGTWDPNVSYKFVNRASGKALDSAGATADGSAVKLWSSGTSTNQRWRIVDAGGGYYKILNQTNGKGIDSAGAAHDGSTLQMWYSNSHTNQQWQIVSLGGGYYRIVNRTTGKAVDTGGATADGSVCQMWYSNSSYNQQWSIVR
ncbi:MAG TPA: RICIN domain-containing protein [Anaeromyxobacter sp.]|nr:RICIN domain-containing protein [Anaeromyxobacter sp.]